MKKLLAVAVLGLLALLANGCGTINARSGTGGISLGMFGEIKSDYQGPYSGVVHDLYMGTIFFPVLLDVPLSFAFDTVLLPFDLLEMIGRRKPNAAVVPPRERKPSPPSKPPPQPNEENREESP
jgi:uncharacterized protein YceK